MKVAATLRFTMVSAALAAASCATSSESTRVLDPVAVALVGNEPGPRAAMCWTAIYDQQVRSGVFGFDGPAQPRLDYWMRAISKAQPDKVAQQQLIMSATPEFAAYLQGAQDAERSHKVSAVSAACAALEQAHPGGV